MPDQRYTRNQGKGFIHTKRGQHLRIFIKAIFTVSTFHNNLESPCCQGDNGVLCAICTLKWNLSHWLKSWVFSETALKDLPHFHFAPYSINQGSNPALVLISQQICVNIPMIRSEPRANWGQIDAGRRPLVGVENCVQEKGQRKKRKKWKTLSPSPSMDISDIGGSQELNWERKCCFSRCTNMKRNPFNYICPKTHLWWWAGGQTLPGQ